MWIMFNSRLHSEITKFGQTYLCTLYIYELTKTANSISCCNQGRIRCGRIGAMCGLNQPTTPLSFSLPFHPSHSRPSPFYLSSPISLPLQGLRWVPRWYGRSPASHRRFLLHLTQPTANERFWCNINFEDLRRVIIAYNTENSKSKRAVKVS